MTGHTSDPDWLVHLRLDVTQLVEPHEPAHRWIGPDKHNQATADNPKLARQRAGGFTWPPPSDTRLEEPLLDQLRQLRDGYAPAGANTEGGRSAPGSRLPGGADTADLVVDIETGIAELLWKALRHLGRQEDLRRSGRDRRIGYVTPSPAQSLRRLVDLAVEIPDGPLRATIVKRIHSWVLAARLALSYSAPMVGLGKTCPHCHEQSLLTRSDASGDVFCTTDGCEDDNGQQPRWPRAIWHILLAGQSESA